MSTAVQPSPAQLHQLAAQSRLATGQAERRREQTRELVAASQSCCAQSRQVLTDRRRVLPVAPAVRHATPALPPAPRTARDRPALAGLAWDPAVVAGVDGVRGGTAGR